jgi:hypothetical protein
MSSLTKQPLTLFDPAPFCTKESFFEFLLCCPCIGVRLPKNMRVLLWTYCGPVGYEFVTTNKVLFLFFVVFVFALFDKIELIRVDS